MNSAIRVFGILADRRETVEQGFAALVKRAKKLGVAPISWEWGKAYQKKERVPHPEYGDQVEFYAMVTRVPLTVLGETPRLNGWAFIGSLQHIDDETIVRKVSTIDIPKVYWSRGPVCDHCKHKRQRNDTYILQHEDGRHTQVGSTCLEDFVGSDKVVRVAQAASLIASACALAESAEDIGGYKGGGASSILLAEYLGYVTLEVRRNGWVPRSAVRDIGGRATADRALERLLDRDLKKEHPSPADLVTAASALEWAEGLTEEQAGINDYLHNIRAIACSGLVDRRTLGLAASIPSAHGRELTRAAIRGRSQHFGTIDKRETFVLTYTGSNAYTNDFGTRFIHQFVDVTGNKAIWNSGAQDLKAGTSYYVTGTVTKHGEWRGEAQTNLTRCKFSTEPPTPKTSKPRAKKAAQEAQ
jgi:hypothetical protein